MNKNEDISREEYEMVRDEYKSTPEFLRTKAVKLLGKFKRIGKKSMKQKDYVLVFYLNMKRQIEGPVLTKLYGGNFLVIRNHVYRFKPQAVYQWGKYSAIVIKAWDRNPVTPDDYDSLVKAGESPFNDPVLIKAILSAKLEDMQKKKQGSFIIWIVLAIVAVVGAFLLFGG